ncbi:MAG TPA: GxxExxY protein [Pyrinomonadaceae bacterium]|nr:GxxExxY protein [Pyrinomonadaceae bacterium]
MIDEELTGQIIKIFYKVYNALGHGFIESVYHNAMIVEFVRSGISIQTEKPLVVYYDGTIVGNFSADLVFEERIILELKAKEGFHPAHEAQLLNYLRATDIELGFLFNFRKQAEFKRKYFSNKNKRKAPRAPADPILENLFKIDSPKSA